MPEQDPSRPARILVVDDDPGLRTLIAASLADHGFSTAVAENAIQMDQALADSPVDLVVLDVMMPGEDGLSICRRLTAQGGPPVIMLSAVGTETDRIVGLEIGADHYLAKPCSPRELLAHVRAVLRRSSQPATEDHDRPEGVYCFMGWRIDLRAHELVDPNGALINLTDGEFAVLRAFVTHPRRVLSRDQLLEAARGPHSDAYDRAVDVQVSRVRRKMKSDDDIIRTIRSEGYMFVPRVERAG
jgi:two-component system OmpR family response regulator